MGQVKICPIYIFGAMTEGFDFMQVVRKNALLLHDNLLPFPF
jgi:hypothetical protein